MKTAHDTLLRSLREEIQSKGARPAIIDELLTELYGHRSEQTSSELLLLLSDEADDEGMFSLIHAAEDLSDRDYVLSLLPVFPDIARSAPRWTSIILMRILNNRTSQQELIAQLLTAPKSVKAAIDTMCSRVAEVDPQFLDKIIPVRLSAQ